ncbi:ribosomal protein S7 domain-containing protein, partial [Gamsiella multidivaricata]|uniref:ribosomal protein S7 domain-containing protein n=1 Tax=Gamsiella multidivaricata TaxID=101098 RepID=UPI0022202196
NPILKQLVNTIMKDGKKARAERFVADALLEIRTRTQSDPYLVVLDALELASPILKLTAIKKGSKVLQVPSPMTERQRRRKAIVWILEASDKRRGEKKFKDRLASEFLAVVNGNSGALAKKNQLHKMALANRANASLK